MDNQTSMHGEVSRDKLVSDLRVVMADAEELLRITASQAGEKASAARERIQASLSAAKLKLSDAERVMVDKTKVVAEATDQYVRENPWAAVGVAAAVGLVLGVLISRR
jgi:ElaB/YqjD/DUF883 family membrane-anchored ribosome-binding protein